MCTQRLLVAFLATVCIIIDWDNLQDIEYLINDLEQDIPIRMDIFIRIVSNV